MAAPNAEVKPKLETAGNGQPQNSVKPLLQQQGQGHAMGRGGQTGARGGRPNTRFSGGMAGGRGARGGSGRPAQRDDRIRGPQDGIKSEKPTTSAEGDNRGHGMNRGGRGGGGPNRYRGGMGGGSSRDDHRGRGIEDRLNEKLAMVSGPTHDLQPLDMTEKKFSGRNRLYIGNFTSDVTEDEVMQMFKPFGEVSELFVNNEKNFAFIRFDYRVNAEKAKNEIDGKLRKGRALKVRFAPHSAAIKVKNLTQWVTNELLERAFSVFGDIERVKITVDERGKSMSEGIVEFTRKPNAMIALRRCSEGCFFLTSSLRPVVVELVETVDDTDGYAEKNLPKKTPDYYKNREMGPRFAAPGSFEYEYGTRWKQLYELKKQKEDALNREMKMEEEKLEAQMEYAKYEHETESLRDLLRQREQDRDRQKREWELKELQAEEQRRNDEEVMRRQQEDMQLRMLHQEEELRRRQQENTLFMQAHQLNSLLDQQEQAMHDSPGNDHVREYDQGTGLNSIPPDPKAFMDSYDRGGGGNGRFEGRGGGDLRDADMIGPNGQHGGPRGMGGGNQRGRWGGQNERRGVADDFPAKRRRY